MPLVSLMSETAAADDEPLHVFDLSEVPQVGEDITVISLEGDETVYAVCGRRFAVDLRENILAQNMRVVLFVRAPEAMTLAATTLLEGIANGGDKSPGPRGPVPGNPPPVDLPSPPPMPNPIPGGG